MLGHLGRSGGSLRVVATELGELVGSPIWFVDEWLDESSLRLTTAAQDAVAAASEGSIVMFDNVRRYEIEQRLWKADIDEWAGRCIRLQPTSARRWAAYVNEAIAASNRDFRPRCPLAMDQRLLGSYIGGRSSRSPNFKRSTPSSWAASRRTNWTTSSGCASVLRLGLS